LKQQQNRVFAFCSSQTIIFPSRLMTGVTILQLDFTIQIPQNYQVTSDLQFTVSISF